MDPASLPYLFELTRSQWLSREKLERLQWRRLKRLLSHAYDRVPYYRSLFDSVGARPADVTSPSDFELLPVTTKETLREVPQDQLLASGVDPERCIERKTSGTTGTPLRLLLSRRQKEAQDMVQARAMLANGLKLVDRRAVFVAPWQIPRRPHWFQRLGFWRKDHYSIFDDVREQMERLEALSPDCISATPAILSLIAQEHHRRGSPGLRPRTIFSTADLLDRPTRELVESAFGVNVIDLYGSLEFGYMAWQCPERRGYHINTESLLMEFPADPQAGIVCTNLLAEAMPLIRYRLGDLCTPTDEVCPCGRGLPLLRLIEGRANDVVRLGGGRTVTPQALADIMVEFYQGLRQFRIVQETIDHVRVLLVPTACGDGTLPVAVETGLRRALGAEVGITIEWVDAIAPDPSGKRRAIVSKLSDP